MRQTEFGNKEKRKRQNKINGDCMYTMGVGLQKK
jgi:hypothetical protein